MSPIKVSIIVPVYNTASFLPKCIDSLLAQTLQEIEIILINDASTDHSLSVMLPYEKQYPNKIRIIDSNINQRQGGARNLGIEAAVGKYIGFVDSDDWVEKEMYELLYHEALKKDSDLCYCYRQQVTEQGKVSKDSAGYFLPVGMVTKRSRLEMLTQHVTFVQRYIYKRTLFIERKIRFPAHLRYEDMLIDPLILLYAKHISAVKRPLYNYFIRSGSTMTEINNTKYKDRIKVCKLIINEYQRRGHYKQYKDEINYLFFRKGYIHTALNYLINTQSPRKDVIANIKNQLVSVDKNYRKNMYYPGKFTFRIIDYVISSRLFFLISTLKALSRVTRQLI
jgi:glycosyltransferase involved in cell wall biosynthesis